jgi:uncharacterized membrane protein (UPF0127 family)
MPGIAVVTRENGAVVCSRCVLADRPLSRLRGLLGRAGLADGEGLLLRPTGAIHTWFMRFPIDAVFLDRDLVVVGVVDDLKPWRAAGRRRSRSVLELASGESARRQIRPGDRLRLEPDGVV